MSSLQYLEWGREWPENHTSYREPLVISLQRTWTWRWVTHFSLTKTKYFKFADISGWQVAVTIMLTEHTFFKILYIMCFSKIKVTFEQWVRKQTLYNTNNNLCYVQSILKIFWKCVHCYVNLLLKMMCMHTSY